MNLLDIVRRTTPPAPWAEGEKIPWNDPAFSQRMLKEHLTQQHDAASRRSAIIDQHVGWIHQELLGGQPGRVIDLGCGPGLYTARLALLGHACLGIDFSPASIEYARKQAVLDGLACEYVLDDVRQADFGQGHNLAMFIFGELNVFHPTDARRILEKAQAALASGGKLLLEVHTYEAVQRMGSASPAWLAAETGLFSDRPHLRLYESFWDARQAAAVERYYLIDAAGGQVERFAATIQAYTAEQYQSLVEQAGFEQVSFEQAMGEEAPSPDFVILTATAAATAARDEDKR